MISSRSIHNLTLAGSVFALLIVFLGLHACSTKSDNTNSTKFTQYYNQGSVLYTQHCSNCHQQAGTGLGRVYPPLNVSDYMDNHFREVICLIRFGKEGQIIVNGKDYNQPMRGIPTLTDLEIAQIATYIYNTWEHERGIVEVKDVSSILQTCPGQD